MTKWSTVRQALWTFLVVCSGSAAAQTQGDTLSSFQLLQDAARAPATARVPVSVAFNRASLDDAVREIARQSGLGISYRPDLPELTRRVSLLATRMPAAEALLRVLDGSGLDLMIAPHGRTLMLRSRPAGAAQPCAIAGTIRGADGLPLASVDVRISGTAGRTITGADGRFCIQRLAAGSYLLEAGLLGYEVARVDRVVVPSDAAHSIAISLTPAAIKLTDVVVTPGHFGIAHEAINQPQTLSREQIETLPQLAEDIYRTVNRLPGVSTNEMSAKFTVRGGDDKSMLVKLDGLELFEPFHLKDFDGSLSILDVAAIGGVDLTTGGFSAENGNRLTGVFDLRTTNRIVPKPRTTIGLSLSNARIMSQGSFANGNGLWLASARRGYLDILLKLIDEEGVDPRYYDLLGKVVYQLSPRHRISINALRAGDTGFLEDDDGVGTISSSYGSTYGWLTWDAELGSRLRVESQISTGALDWNRDAEEHGTGNDFDVKDFREFQYVGVKQDWQANLTDRFALKWGGEMRSASADYDYYARVGRTRIESGQRIQFYDSTAATLSPSGTDMSAYVAQRARPWFPLTIETGLRWDRQSVTGTDQLSPRVNAALSIGARTTIRAAWGRYAQPQLLYQLHVQDNEQQFSRPERAEQMVLGIERSFGHGITARVETYRRNEFDLRPRYRNLRGTIEPVAEVENDRVRFDPERARAEGIELFGQRHGVRSSWSVSYALAHAYDVVEGRKQDRPLDQRHTFYLDYSLAPSPAWRLSWSWQYHSGWPITASTFHADSLTNGDIWFIEGFGQHYADRLPSYHRMDLRVTRNFELKRGRLAMFLDVFNLYDRDNPQSYNYNINFRNGRLDVTRGIEPLLPRLPTIGVTWEF
ncbi:MAG: carboxypeptidase regulatory-like domain-containing protein [Gemmatimonadota bacterium]